MKPSSVDRTFDPLSNGMHDSFLAKVCMLIVISLKNIEKMFVFLH